MHNVINQNALYLSLGYSSASTCAASQNEASRVCTLKLDVCNGPPAKGPWFCCCVCGTEACRLPPTACVGVAIGGASGSSGAESKANGASESKSVLKLLLVLATLAVMVVADDELASVSWSERERERNGSMRLAAGDTRTRNESLSQSSTSLDVLPSNIAAPLIILLGLPLCTPPQRARSTRQRTSR